MGNYYREVLMMGLFILFSASFFTYHLLYRKKHGITGIPIILAVVLMMMAALVQDSAIQTKQTYSMVQAQSYVASSFGDSPEQTVISIPQCHSTSLVVLGCKTYISEFQTQRYRGIVVYNHEQAGVISFEKIAFNDD